MLDLNVKPAEKSPLINKVAEEFLEAMANGLDVPDSRYESANTSYHSVGGWLNRQESTLRSAKPSVSPQGSFALGTVIRPLSEDEGYDVDMLCVFQFEKTKITQQALGAASPY